MRRHCIRVVVAVTSRVTALMDGVRKKESQCSHENTNAYKMRKFNGTNSTRNTVTYQYNLLCFLLYLVCERRTLYVYIFSSNRLT